MIRSIRDKNYEETKDMNRQELLEWYKTRGKVAENISIKAPIIQRTPAKIFPSLKLSQQKKKKTVTCPCAASAAQDGSERQ